MYNVIQKAQFIGNSSKATILPSKGLPSWSRTSCPAGEELNHNNKVEREEQKVKAYISSGGTQLQSNLLNCSHHHQKATKVLSGIRMDPITSANTEFCLDVFKELSSSNVGENIFFSPFSVFYALSMLLLGARGKSAEQMGKVLHYENFSGFLQAKMKNSSECDQVGRMHPEFRALVTHINQQNSLSIANRIYGTKAIEFNKQYIRCCEKLYQAKLQTVDFELSAEETRKSINTWVKNKTNGYLICDPQKCHDPQVENYFIKLEAGGGKITNLFVKGTIDPSSVMVLVSAIYFKGQWQNKFQKTETVKAPFHMSVGKSAVVDMMYQTGTFKLAFIKEPQMQVLELPYANNKLRMVILLPVGTASVSQIEKHLNMKMLQEWTNPSNMVEREVEVHIPKFSLSVTYDLNTLLKSLGMRDIFNVAQADLSGMSPDKGLYLSKVVHKSYVDVNEEGTEAAAATGESISVKRLPVTVQFTANCPFLFFIWDESYNVLFAGKFASP
ncbi:Serpin B11 [Apodemus speciosus]|uniref:Serpin B11 n=1 Tax=Apodemus speciosus TaxID=105296 RepID=A0ABQ0EDY4_APOSI